MTIINFNGRVSSAAMWEGNRPNIKKKQKKGGGKTGQPFIERKSSPGGA